MDFHNTSEDIVVSAVQSIFDEIQHSGNPDGLCLCYQCQIDTICYALNRVAPHYIVSNRGLTRIEQTGIGHQQAEADVSTLVYKGLRLVNHNLRPTAPHDGSPSSNAKMSNPVFDIPTIAGRIFNGESFEPVVDINVELTLDGEMVPMRNNNWQNPYKMVSSTPGVFSFWPAPITASTPDVSHEFRFSIKISSPDYEPLQHFFEITCISRYHNPHSYALNRTFKLPDMYLFPPGEAEINE